MANTVATYQGRITSEHADKPKFMALVGLLSQCYVDAQAVVNSLATAFDLDVAVGSQLDTDALWIGASRGVQTPIENAYFSFDDETHNVGFDEGIWFLPLDPQFVVQSLDDESFRLFLRFKIAANHWDGTTASLYTILTELFSPAVVTISEGTMTCNITITGMPPSTLFKTLTEDGVLPTKAAGVAFTYTFA